MIVKFTNSQSKPAVSLLKAISLPLSASLFLFPASQNVSAQSLWGDRRVDLPNGNTELIVKEKTDRSQQEEANDNDRSQRDIPDVVIDDGETQPEESSSSQPESDDKTSTTTTSNKTRFTCQMVNGEYTVMYHPESRPDEAYAWAVPRQMGGGWSEERRCYEISRRLESYRPDGLLEMRTAVENNYNTVCVTTQQDSRCRIVFTVPPGQDPMVTRDRVFENLTIADGGQQTQGVSTLVNNGRPTIELGQIGQVSQIGRVLSQDLSKVAMRTRTQSSRAIDLRPFLDPSDGGTGTRLHGSPFRSSPSNSNTQRLEPENFR
jgi:Circadian oscillating protein COP23